MEPHGSEASQLRGEIMPRKTSKNVNCWESSLITCERALNQESWHAEPKENLSGQQLELRDCLMLGLTSAPFKIEGVACGRLSALGGEG